ncbi:class I SAM-dependent methyltransferase [Thalassospira tepidiphila]|uniref:class I SAM-dependent methyltransferase n=1 Tax=Thalassospira tepidiphila TaxID=393657 RepID=UPI002922A5CD|nr:hypothetical protein MACH01_31180 [Thalassospira tepidiphila]
MIAEYTQHWDHKFRTRSWGRYPPEDLVRFFGRSFRSADKAKIRVLEVGCGTGANLWFLHREGFAVAGIDGSSHGVELAHKRLKQENAELNSAEPDLKAGDFSVLPWEDGSFDVVIDIFAIYANLRKVINSTVSEVYRVMKPGALFYSKLWGVNCEGVGTGVLIEPKTFDKIGVGPCKDMGVSHFFDMEEIENVFGDFEMIAIDRHIRSDSLANISAIEEYHCVFKKPDFAV